MAKKGKITIIIIIGIILVMLGLYIKAYWIPYKYAIKENEFSKYGSYVLLQEAHYTGTGWVQVGDENGYFSPDAYRDVYLTNGMILPQMSMYQKDYANTFLCIVGYNGKTQHAAFENEIDSYDIKEWYPVYPVLRDTLLPDWMFPKGFMNKMDIKR